jgi:hypothetical protein
MIMKTVYSERHRLQDGKAELIDGRLLPCFEKPERAELIIARVRAVGLGEVVAPQEHGLEPLRRVHGDDFLRFLEHAWDQWVAAHGAYDALPLCWPTRGLRQIEPDSIDGKLSYFSFDAGTPITAGTWQAARSAADVALTGAELIAGGAERAVFALCRPPGHHAARDCYGGYCFLNNAALAAQALRGGIQVEDLARQIGRPFDAAGKAEIDQGVRRAAYRIIEGKGATWYGIAGGLVRIVQSIGGDENSALTVSIVTEEVEGVGPVALSLPRIVGRAGVVETLLPSLRDEEHAALAQSAQVIKEALAGRW